jgi:hypothetical protein
MSGYKLARQAVGLDGAEQDPVAGGQADERQLLRYAAGEPCRCFIRLLELAAQDAKLLEMKLAFRATANVLRHRLLIRERELAVGERLQQVGDLFTACCAHLLHHSL